MAIAYLTFFTGIAISLVAIYYSVMGLTAIFAAAVLPIVIMGTILEVAKLVTTVWLKQNWSRSPISLKAYLSIAVLVLMLITSMGIFGFLSKAHLDQGVPTGDVAAKVALYDEKIKTERDNIDAARRALAQMDASIDQTLGRSTTEQGADKAVAIRKSQAKERANLQKDIATAQTNIAKLNAERAPIASELRKVEAEVGPIKYIAALIYGENPDQNILEKAVTWVIITIIFVFDPLAVLLLLASQYSFAWANDTKKDWTSAEKWDSFFNAPPADIPNPKTINPVNDEEARATEANALLAELEKEPETEVFEEPNLEAVAQELSEEPEVQISIDQWNKLLEEAEREVLAETRKLTKPVELPTADLSSPGRFGLGQQLKTEEVKFPEDPFLGQQLTLKDRAYIYNGNSWVESPLSQEHRATDLERPGDYVQNSEQSDNSLWTKIKTRNGE